MKKVYLASPYSKGDLVENMRVHMAMANQMIENGFAPFIPLLFHFQHFQHPQPYEKWCEIDIEWINCCDCLLRLPGESAGANKEVAHAQHIGIPVYFSLEELMEHEEPLNI